MALPILRIRDDGTIAYPYSLTQFRADEPRLSISHDPHDAELASYATLVPPILVLRPLANDPPAYDPATHYPVEVLPVQGEDGLWRQAWVIEPLPPPPVPEAQPDWAAFRQALIDENGYAPAFAAISNVNPMLTGPLPARLDRFEFEGHWQPFLDSLSIALDALPSDPTDPSLTAGHLAMELLALASRCNLPMPFREALQDLFEEPMP